MSLLVTTYHYFGDYKTPYPGIHSMSEIDFERQVIALGEEFTFISEAQLLSAIEDGSVLSERSCLLTFDDGLRSQYEIAVKVLDRLAVPAIFFINGLPLKEKRALNIHKIHWLRSILSPVEFLNRIISHFDEVGFDFQEEMISVDKVSDKFFWDDVPTKKLKYLLNILLPFDKCQQIVQLIFAECVPDESKFCEMFYMDEAQILDLHKRYAVGTHTYSHLVLGAHPNEEILREIEQGMAALKGLIGQAPNGVSYPYGYKEAVTTQVAEISERTGLRYGFTVERSLNASLKDPLLLARIDCNDAPHGKDPLFTFKNNEFVPEKHLTSARTRYFSEHDELTSA